MGVRHKKLKWLLVGAAAFALFLVLSACGSETAVIPTPTAMEPFTPEATAVPKPTATSTGTAPSPPGNVPLIPGANFLISVIDEQGQPVLEGTVEALIENAVFPERNFQDSFDLTSFPDGLIPVHPTTPEHIPATLSIRVVTPDGGVSDTLVIRNDEWGLAFVDSELDFVAVHEFDLSKTGVTTNLTLVVVDIKPGSDRNCINLGSEDVISVAILTTPIFDATGVDQTSLTLEGVAARVKGKSGNIGSFEDMDGDGDLDLVMQFPTADLQLTELDSEVILEGATLIGAPIQGVDARCARSSETSAMVADASPTPPSEQLEHIGVAEFSDRPLGSEAREAEWFKVQVAMDTMMAYRGVGSVDVVATANNVWTALPTGERSAPLAIYLEQDKTEYYYCWGPIGLMIQQHEVPGPCPVYDGMSVRPSPTPTWAPPPPHIGDPILHPTGAGDVLVQSRSCGPWPPPELFVPDFTLYGDGALIYRVYDEDVPGYLLFHGKLTEVAIQEVLHRAVEEAHFFDSKDRYVNHSVLDAGTTCITVRTAADGHSVYVYALYVFDLITEVPRDMTPQELAQVRRLLELDRWLLNIDLRNTDSGDWMDLGPFIPEAISLFITPGYNSAFGHQVSLWPFSELDLGAFPLSPIGRTMTTLEGELAREVYQFLSVTPVFIFSQGDVQAKVAYRPHLPYEEQWRDTN